MGAYLIRRLLLVIPTLWAIITINFFIVQIAPGGPVDQAIAAIEFGNAGVLPGAGGEGVRASHAQTGVGNAKRSLCRAKLRRYAICLTHSSLHTKATQQ